MKTQRSLIVIIASLLLSVLSLSITFTAMSTSTPPDQCRVASAGIETLTVAPGLTPQGRTILIDLLNQHYMPPKRTLKIPPGFRADDSQKPAQLAVRAGDTLKFCNLDSIRYQPFSYSRENKFESASTLGPSGILQGQCWIYVVKNPTQIPIAFTLSDVIHSNQKLSLVVLPANYPDEGEEDTPSGETAPSTTVSLKSGDYEVDAAGYPGVWSLTISGDSVIGKATFECCPGHRVDPLNGSIDGQKVEITRTCQSQGYDYPCVQVYSGTISGQGASGEATMNGKPLGHWSMTLKSSRKQ